jgi:hypothetical protein
MAFGTVRVPVTPGLGVKVRIVGLIVDLMVGVTGCLIIT